MIFLIILLLLFSTTHAVHINSIYFQSESVMPSDCTIQPTQQECIEYAQLTMQQEVALVEVSSGQPATFDVEVTSGSPAMEGSAEYLSETECSQVSGYVTFADWSTTASGCVFWSTPRTVYYNRNINTHECGHNSQWCIQKSPTAALYVTESECAAYTSYGGAWQAGSGTFPVGCISNGVTYYWNPDVAGDAGTACGSSSWNCIQKHSYYNFGHVEVTAGLPALEGDIRHVTEKECQVYAVSVGESLSIAISSQGSDQWENYIQGCQADNTNVYWNPSTSSTIECGHNGNKCIQRDVITHHAAAEGCLSDGKVRWNIPFVEVTSGEPANTHTHVTSGSQPAVEGSPEWMSETECEQYKIDYGYSHFFTQTSTGRPEGCWLYVSGSSAQILSLIHI